MDEHVQDLLSKGFIEPSTSSFGAPVLFVRKKNGKMRMCIDYRALNSRTRKNKYPLPRIDELFDQLAGATIFSSLDLRSGYHQIRIHDDDVEETAFLTPHGSYHFRVLSFGLTNAPATFQAVMNDILRDYLGKFVLVYLDDILIFSKSREEHVVHLRLVFQKLRESKLFAGLSKCNFGKHELPFLGHIISAGGIQVDPAKTAADANWPVPHNVPELQSFLGSANYFRRFLEHMSMQITPLYELCKKNRPFLWTPSCQKAFEWVKKALQEAPVLLMPSFHKPFEIRADASGTGIGAVLLQNDRPVAYESRRFKPAECNYTVGEQEMLAVVHACMLWRCYIEGSPHPVKIVTDHQPFTYLPTKCYLSPTQTRWAEKLDLPARQAEHG